MQDKDQIRDIEEKQEQANEALSDDQLDQVAGGARIGGSDNDSDNPLKQNNDLSPRQRRQFTDGLINIIH